MINFFIPFFAAISSATATTLEKISLKVKKIDSKLYQTASFLSIVILMIPFIVFFWKTNDGAFELNHILIFVAVIVFSFLANWFAYYAMKWEKLSNIEPAKLMEPLFTVILALIFSFIFGQVLYDRSTHILIPALIAAAALVFSHIKKHHFEFNGYFIAAIIGSFFFAVELTISRLILNYYSPLTFYFIRCFFVLLFSLVIFRPNFKKINGKKHKLLIILVGAIWILFRILLYYGYMRIGIIETTLLMLLAPVFVYIFAWKFLKEKISWRNVVAGIIILGCVVYALIG